MRYVPRILAQRASRVACHFAAGVFALALIVAPATVQAQGLFGDETPANPKATTKTPAKAKPVEEPPFNYQQDPVSREAMGLRSVVSDVLNGAPLGGREADFDRYFNEYEFPQFTQKDSIDNLARLRQQFKQRYLWRNSNKQVHDKLNQMTLSRMTRVAAGNYHPFARYNAMLMIGELNEQEPTFDRVGVPYRPALPILLKAVDAASLPSGVKVAALLGILRHAESGRLTDDEKNLVRASMEGIVKSQVAQGMDPNAHDWIRRRAIDVLAAVGEPGAKNSVVKLFEGLVVEKDESLDVRSTASRSLGKLNYQKAEEIAPKEYTDLVKHLGQLAVEAYRHELTLLEEAANSPRVKLAKEIQKAAELRAQAQTSSYEGYTTPPVAMGPGMGPGRGLFAGPGGVAPTQTAGTKTVDIFNPTSGQRLARRLDSVRQALAGASEQQRGLSALAQDPAQQKLVTDVVARLDALIGEARKLTVISETDADRIRQAGEQLAALVIDQPALPPRAPQNRATPPGGPNAPRAQPGSAPAAAPAQPPRAASVPRNGESS